MLQWCTITYTELNYLLNSNLKYKTTATCFSWMSNEMFQKEKETELYYFELFILCWINRTDQYNFWGCSWEMFKLNVVKIFSIITQVQVEYSQTHNIQNVFISSFICFVLMNPFRDIEKSIMSKFLYTLTSTTAFMLSPFLAQALEGTERKINFNLSVQLKKIAWRLIKCMCCAICESTRRVFHYL